MRQRGLVWWIYLVALAAIVAAAWWIYSSIESTGYDRGMAKCAKDAKDQRDKELLQGDKASKGLEASNAKSKVIFRTITRNVDKIIDRPIFRNVCFDPDGLSIANAALSGTSPDPGKPDAAVPTPDTAPGSLRGLRAP